jgi:hypothetical protein
MELQIIFITLMCVCNRMATGDCVLRSGLQLAETVMTTCVDDCCNTQTGLLIFAAILVGGESQIKVTKIFCGGEQFD